MGFLLFYQSLADLETRMVEGWKDIFSTSRNFSPSVSFLFTVTGNVSVEFPYGTGWGPESSGNKDTV